VGTRKGLQRFQQEDKELSIKPICDLRTKHLEERGNDMIQARLDSDFCKKFATILFYTIEHNSKSNRWIKLKHYHKISDVFIYVVVNFQVN
jgi:hypothetical protein